MSKFDFAEEAKKAETSNYFKPKEGNNYIRVVSEFRLYESEYQGKKTRKFVGFVIDRTDGAVKPAFLAKTIMDQIAALQQTPDYHFEEVPMPYDVNIAAKGAGTIDVEYSVIAARSNTPLTDVELKAISEQDTVDEFIQTLEDGKKIDQGELSQMMPGSHEAKAMTTEEEAAWLGGTNERPVTPADIVAKASGGRFDPRQ